MSGSPEYGQYARQMVAKLGKPIPRPGQAKVDGERELIFHRLGPFSTNIVYTEISFLFYTQENVHEVEEGVYIKTNRTLAELTGDKPLQKRILDEAFLKLRNPDKPDEPLEAHLHEQASLKNQKATFKLGPPEEAPPQETI